MPRLVGHRSHPAVGGGILVAVAIAIAIALEAVGVIDVIPGFGRDSSTAQTDTSIVIKT